MPELFRLTKIAFRAGRVPGSGPTELIPGDVTIAVGPNNSGKSLLLRELEQWATGDQTPPVSPWPGGKVISGAEAHWPENEAELRDALKGRAVPDSAEGNEAMMIYSFEPQAGGAQGTGEVLVEVSNRWGIDFGEFCRTMVMKHFRMRLDGRQRFSLADPRQVSSLDRGPSSAVMALWRDGRKYRRVRAMILNAIGRHFVVNVADLPSISISLSDEVPPDGVEQSLADDVIAYQRRATPLQEFSDGIQIYTGLVAAVHSLPHALLLVDEPEAYLHPTLARRLGSDLATIARERKGNLIAATHSADFLIGCVSEVPETSIVRLTFDAGVATARTLDGVEVARLTRDPLLRSAEALRALFAHATVVCEADSDRAFYEEINRRLLDADGRSGCEDTIFLNAQNWQTIPTIAAPLRRLGIPAAMVVDLDTLIEGVGWSAFIAALGLDSAVTGPLNHRRDACARLLVDAGRVGGEGTPYFVKRDGLDALDGSARSTVEAFVAELNRYGVFVVPVGELENWLSSLGVTNKQRWVTEMLTRLGTRGSEAYLPPAVGDVWEFVEAIAGWTRDPNRLGLPS